VRLRRSGGSVPGAEQRALDGVLSERIALTNRSWKSPSLAKEVLATLAVAGVCVVGATCGRSRDGHAERSVAASRAELGVVAAALEDQTAGPFFPPDRLTEAVSLVRRIHREYPQTRDVGVIPFGASELSAYQSLPFDIPDSLCAAVRETASGKTRGYAKQWLDLWRSGNRAFDSVTDSMGGAKVLHLQCMQPSHSMVTVYYRKPLNIPGVARAYAGIPGFAVSPLYQMRLGSGVAFHIDARGSDWLVNMLAGWGDCPSGCINKHLWRFKYDRMTGNIELVTDSDPPVRRERN
jgi:hypothetical protein